MSGERVERFVRGDLEAEAKVRERRVLRKQSRHIDDDVRGVVESNAEFLRIGCHVIPVP